MNQKVQNKMSTWKDEYPKELPVGTVISFMGNTAPSQYLKCDGTIYNIADYPLLAEFFKTQFGSKNYFGGNGSTTFAVPDLKGEFLRCTGTNSHNKQGNGSNVGSHQAGTIHTFYNYIGLDSRNTNQFNIHASSTEVTATVDTVDRVSNDDTGNNNYISFYGGYYTHTSQLSHGIGTSRPTNTSVWYLIKALDYAA